MQSALPEFSRLQYVKAVLVQYENIFTILPALAVGCTGKGRFGVTSRLHCMGRPDLALAVWLHWAIQG